jgi:hypothetical protein
MQCTNYNASEEIIGSPKFRLLIRSQVFRLPFRGMIAMHRSQPQHHLSFPSHEKFPIKSRWFQYSSKPSNGKLPKILVFGLLEIRQLSQYFNLEII